MKPAVRKSGSLPRNVKEAARKSSTSTSRVKQVTQYASSAAFATAARESAAESLSQAASSIKGLTWRLERIANMAKEKYDSLSPRTKVELRRFKREWDRHRLRHKALEEQAAQKNLSAQQAEEIEAEANKIAAAADQMNDAIRALPASPTFLRNQGL